MITDEQIQIISSHLGNYLTIDCRDSFIVDALNEYENRKWIKFNVNDAKTHPENDSKVIVCTDQSNIYQANFHSEYECPEYGDIDAAFFECSTDNGWIDYFIITHWQSLPEPPKSE